MVKVKRAYLYKSICKHYDYLENEYRSKTFGKPRDYSFNLQKEKQAKEDFSNFLAFRDKITEKVLSKIKKRKGYITQKIRFYLFHRSSIQYQYYPFIIYAYEEVFND